MAADGNAVPKPPDDFDAGAAALDGATAPGAEAAPLELDRVIHERVRLGIVSSLAVNGSLTFTDLRDLLGITDGNLSAHARKLEEAGYLETSKSFDGPTPKTVFGLTKTGRRELEAYLDHMEAIIRATRDEAGR
jgi:DNA-binding MarR family transcriptional regulator